MYLRNHFQLSMAATAYTPWIDTSESSVLTIQTDCGDVASPVGVITAEYSSDYETIENEKAAGVASADSLAVKVDRTNQFGTPGGAAWATGYDGVGVKASLATATGPGCFVRLKYTRTGGGAGDVLHVRVIGRGSGV